MPSRETPETILIRREEWAARAHRSSTKSTPRPPPAPPLATSTNPSSATTDSKPAPPGPGWLTAKWLKVSTTLDAAELLAIPASEGRPRVTLRIRLPDRTATAEIASKSLRRAQATIREQGPDNVVCVVQGHLVEGDTIAEAGLSAQPKATKAPPQ